jgi:hypothetical protein
MLYAMCHAQAKQISEELTMGAQKDYSNVPLDDQTSTAPTTGSPSCTARVLKLGRQRIVLDREYRLDQANDARSRFQMTQRTLS